MPPAISIVMPCFNAQSSLENAVFSMCAQTVGDWELLLVDDGSTDDSPRLMSLLARHDARIRVMELPHVGIVSALQRGIRESTALYIARMDADDVAHPSRLEKQFELMQSDSALALCGTQVRAIGDGITDGRQRYIDWLNGLTSHDEIVREIFVECPVAHPTFFMRREAYLRVGGYRDCAWPEDYDLIMRLWLDGGRFANVDDILLDWHDTPDRLSMTDPRYNEGAFRALKRHFLRESGLLVPGPDGVSTSRGRPVQFYQWGAGEVGKRWLREWISVRPAGVVDINERKIGEIIHDTPVVPPDELPPPGQVFVLIAVGTLGARDLIRGWLLPRGYVEGVDFLFVA
ncbi:MAG: glycosyltransferase [Candidatus Hydrogenedentes bacterium]|nr:glycosyltransferase [Candidatus Hydrogenedentota bacterium]